MSTFYECKRCFHKFSQKNDIVRHLNRKNPCCRILLSYQLFNNCSTEHLYELSIIKNKKVDNETLKSEFICERCNKIFINNNLFKKHIEKNNCKINCKLNFNKNILNDNNILNNSAYSSKIFNNQTNEFLNEPFLNDTFLNETLKKDSIDKLYKSFEKIPEKSKLNELNIIKEDENTFFKGSYIENFNQTNNHITDSNVTNIKDSNITNINLNINLINSFDEEWNTTHIDDKIKFILLCQNAKFTSTLEKILENEVNQNVLFDNNNLKGLVYKDKKLINMDIKDIIKKTMEKLFNQLSTFKKDIIENNELSINHNIINEEMSIIDKKYEDFKLDKENVSNKVNNCITDIYNKKRENTIHNFTMISNINENINDNDEGY